MEPQLQDLLAQYRAGQSGALDRLIPMVYEDLKRLARRHMSQWPSVTLQTTSLVHEAYLKLANQHSLDAIDQAHFLAICGQAMRQLIIDHARKRLAYKRGPDMARLDIEEIEIPVQAEAGELLLIDQALTSLAEVDIRLVRVFECRYFAGLTEEETAQALGQSLRTVQRDWMRARAWLKELLTSP